MSPDADQAHRCNQSGVQVRVEGNLMRIIDELEQIRVRPVWCETSDVCDLLVFSHFRDIQLNEGSKEQCAYALGTGIAMVQFLPFRWTWVT